MEALFVVVEGATARWLTLERGELVEQRKLLNPEHRLPEREIFSESKSGRRDVVAGPAQSFDDHRGAHGRESDRRFAKAIVQETLRMLESKDQRVVLVSGSPMLGLLRPEIGMIEARGTRVVEVDRNWSGWKSHQIHDALAQLELVTPRPRRGVES